MEDVERWADLSFFSPLNIKFKVSVVRFAEPQNQIFDQILVSDKCHQNLISDRQTDRQTDGISMFWAFLVLEN